MAGSEPGILAASFRLHHFLASFYRPAQALGNGESNFSSLSPKPPRSILCKYKLLWKSDLSGAKKTRKEVV